MLYFSIYKNYLGQEQELYITSFYIFGRDKKIVTYNFRYQNIYVFSAHIRLLHIFDHLILLENSILTNINSKHH